MTDPPPDERTDAVPALQPVDDIDAFVASAPTRFARSFDIARPAAEVWAELVGERPLHWCRGLATRWTSSRPFGVGTTRDATVLGLLTVREHFVVWEEGRRHAFHGTDITVPLFTRLAEDFLVDPTGDGRCTLTWRVGIEPSTVGKAGGPVNSLLFGSFFRDTARFFGAP